MVKMNNIIREYIDKYGIRDNENEEKRVRNLVNKIHETKSVFSNFPFDYMAKEEQLTLLNFIMTSLPERQIMANMKKTDVDRCYMNFVYRNDNDILNNEMFKEEFDGYSPIDLSNEIIQSRYIIRFSPESEKKNLEDLLQMNENILALYCQERALFRMVGLQIDNEQYIKEYIDYVANVILQFMVYKVIRNCNIEDKIAIKKISDKIKELNILINKQLERQKNKWITEKEANNSQLNAEGVTSCFSMYVTHRSKFYEEYEIKQILKREMDENSSLFGTVPQKWKAPKVFIKEEDIKKVQNIITEGCSVDQYNKKIKVVRKFIDIMNIYGMRDNYSLCLQDLKVYFREIFISKASYKKRKASRIVKDYLNKFEEAKNNGDSIPDFSKQSQYMFIREKISRGYFREVGLSNGYIEKIELEKKLYELLLKLYLFYDVQTSLEFIYDINKKLLNTYRILFL